MPIGPRKGVQSLEDGSEDEESQCCPICLNVPMSSERALPDICNHIFCLGCILRWSQLLQICPVDRRPFSAIFKQDPLLGCIKVPVQASSAPCSCKDGETAACFLIEEKTKVGENGDKRANSTLKCQICDAASTAVKKKKVKRQTCRSQLLNQHVQHGLSAEQGRTLGMLNQVITETVVMSEEEPIDKDWRACRRNMLNHQWLPVSIPSSSPCIPSILNRQYPRAPSFSLQPLLPLSTSPCSLVSAYPAPFGKACPVTCTKNEGRKGTRGSGSKGPNKQAENLKTTRSTRNRKSKSVNEEPSSQSKQSDSSSPAGSEPNDTAASTSKQRLTGKQKPTTKRRGSTKKAATRQAVVESEEEGNKESEKELTDEQGLNEEEEEEKNKNESEANMEELQEVETNEGTQEDQSSNPGDVRMDVDLGSDSVAHGVEQKIDVDLENSVESEQISTLSKESDEEDMENEVKPKDNQASPKMDHSEEEEPEKPPAISPERDLQPSVPSVEQGTVKGFSENTSSIMSQPQDDLSTAIESSLEKETDSKPEPDTTVVPVECKIVTDEVCKSPMLGSISPTAENCLQKNQDPLTTAETVQEGSLDIINHQDNTEAIPMDCDSPGSDNTSVVGEIILESNNAVHGLQVTSVDQTPSQDNKQNNQATEHKSEASEGPKGTDRADGRQRKSRFHSPTTTWSPKSDRRREGSRRSRSRDRNCNASSPRRSRGREHEDQRGSSRWNCSRDRRSRRRSRSRSRNRSRSRSRNRSYRRSSSSERTDQGAQSPRKRDSWGGDGWRGAHSSRNSNWRSNSERQSQFPARESNSSANGSLCPPEASPDRGQLENPHWVKERSRIIADSKEREQHFEDKSNDASDSWSRGGRGFEQGRPAGRDRGGLWPSGQYGESADNWRQQRNFSGTPNNTGSDSYSHFNENRPGGKRQEHEFNDSPLDRSGWSAASSWAVRRTLPADVQNYYSRRDRGPGPGGSIWNKQEEEQPAAGVSRQTDLPQSEPNTHIPNEAVPAPPTMLPHHLNVLGVLRYPVAPMGPPGPPLSVQQTPFTMPAPIPVHLHPPGPPLQIPTMALQALPPPPPPPPPVQQGRVTILSTDTHPQMITSTPVPGKAQVKASPSQAAPSQALPTNTPSVAQPSSTTQPSSHSKAHADSSKKEKKLHIQEKAITEVKAAIKPYYQKKDITKEEYKEIVRKAVEKVCHSKSGEVNASKVANLVKAYVDKYKHVRKNKTDKN